MNKVVRINNIFLNRLVAGILALLIFAAPSVYAEQSPPALTGASASIIPADPGLQQLPGPGSTIAAAANSAPPATAQNPLPSIASPSPPPIPALSNSVAPTSGLPPPTDTAAGSSDPSDSAVNELARDEAFTGMVRNVLPMRTDQIKKLRSLFADSTLAATTAPGGVPPKPVTGSQLVKLEPGAPPAVVRPYQGVVTVISFLDSTGSPWPVQSYDIGNPAAYNIQWDRVSNILMVQPTALYTQSNLVVTLKGLSTPVLISLVPGQPVVDYRVDLRVPGAGPNAKPSSTSALPEAASDELLNVLDGVPPEKSQPLRIPGSNSQAWLKGDKMYVRTHYTLLSPAHLASMSSGDGTHAYQIPKVSSLLVTGDDGKILHLAVEGL